MIWYLFHIINVSTTMFASSLVDLKNKGSHIDVYISKWVDNANNTCVEKFYCLSIIPFIVPSLIRTVLSFCWYIIKVTCVARYPSLYVQFAILKMKYCILKKNYRNFNSSELITNAEKAQVIFILMGHLLNWYIIYFLP